VNETAPRYKRLHLALFTLSALVAIFLGFFALDFAGTIHALRNFAVPFLLIGIGLFCFHGVHLFRRHRATLLLPFSNRIFVIAFPLVALAFLVNQPLGYKMVMDEILLAGAAHQIYENADPFVPRGAILENSQVSVVHTMLDKRGLFHPLLVASVHHLTGYRVANIFYLNAFLTVLILAILWGISYTRAGPTGGLCGLLLAVSLPLLALTGTSGGFETLNLLFLLLLFLGITAALRDRDSTSISFLGFTALLLAQIRYESAIFVAAAAVVIVWVWWREKKIILPFSLIILPILFLNIPWQNSVFEAAPQVYQLHSKPDKEAVFALSYVPENLGHALNFFLASDPAAPNSLPLFLLGAPSLIFLLLRLRRRLAEQTANAMEGAALIICLALAGHFFLMMLYFWGQYDDPIIYRLSLPTWLLFWMAIIFLLAEWSSKGARAIFIPAGLAVLWVAFTLPHLAKHTYAVERFAPRVFEEARRWVNENRDGRYFFVSDHAIFWIIEGIPSIEPVMILDWDEVVGDKLRKGTYEEILTFSIHLSDSNTHVENLPSSVLEPPKELITEEFYREMLDDRGGFEIRRVIGVKDENLEHDSP